MTIITDAFLINSYHYGLGRHIYYLEPGQITQTFKWLWAAEPTNLFAVFLVRLSICLFFLRLIPPKKIYLWIIRGTIAALVLSDIFVSIIYFFECRPIRKVWEPATPGECFDQRTTSAAVWLYQGEFALLHGCGHLKRHEQPANAVQAVSIIADIILLVIPVHLFWRLNVQMRTKLALMFICCLGIL